MTADKDRWIRRKLHANVVPSSAWPPGIASRYFRWVIIDLMFTLLSTEIYADKTLWFSRSLEIKMQNHYLVCILLPE